MPGHPSDRTPQEQHTLGKTAHLVLILALASAAAHAASDLRIGAITIVTEDVFTEQEAAEGGAYAWTNALHIATRPAV
ncbi:MAG TPA: hypothetical protein VLV48_00700, partial [Thermoanaerobaculia bacterium]|nr:hypothetical protein [Thermoanaerobaculia bacterium]